MYIPNHNAAADAQLIETLVERHSFALLVVPRSDRQVELAHLPFLFDPAAGRLRVHTARANRIWRDAMSSSRRGDVVTARHA